MSEKWTPGPWRVEAETTVIWSDNAYDPGTNCVGCIVARAAQPATWRGSRPTADEQEANARLIAAAPDLAEALTIIAEPVDLATCAGDPWAFYRDLQAVARAALAKARGQS